jgi:hypothetical protein
MARSALTAGHPFPWRSTFTDFMVNSHRGMPKSAHWRLFFAYKGFSMSLP